MKTLLKEGSLPGLEIIAVCVLLAALVAVASCVKYKCRSSFSFKLPDRLRKQRRKRSGRRTRSDQHTPRIEEYEEALSVSASSTMPNERQKVDSAGYTEVMLTPKGTQVAPPDAGPSQYNVLGASEYRPRSESDPQSSCKAYDHVVLVRRLSDLCTSDNGVGSDEHVQAVTPTGNEYDVSVVAVELPRVKVIGEVYDKLQNLPQ